MDLVSAIVRLRPDVTWLHDTVTPFSLDTIAETYQSSQPLPTMEEIEAEWLVMEQERLDQEEAHTEKKANKIDVDSLSVAEIRALIHNKMDVGRLDTIANTKEAAKAIFADIEDILVRLAVTTLRD